MFLEKKKTQNIRILKVGSWARHPTNKTQVISTSSLFMIFIQGRKGKDEDKHFYEYDLEKIYCELDNCFYYLAYKILLFSDFEKINIYNQIFFKQLYFLC